MKATLRLPTDQYAYIEVQVEGDFDEIVNAYRKLKTAWNKKEEDKKLKVASSMRAKEIANPIDHIDISLEELPINE